MSRHLCTATYTERDPERFTIRSGILTAMTLGSTAQVAAAE